MFTKLSSSSTMAYPSPLILAVVLFVALFVSSAFSRHAPPPPDITSLCAQTPDPETCENSFIQNSKYYFSSSDHLTNQKLNLNVLGLISIRLDLLVPTASRAADDTLNIASNVKPSHRAKTAWNDCAKLTKACVRDLLDIGDPRATRCAADVEARLSAARTRLDTCHDGLKEAGQGGDSLLPSTINIVITLISQALASIVKVHPIIGPTNRHKGSFPTWVSPRDRKLLQAPAPPTSPVTTPPTTPSAPPPNTLTPPPPPPPPLTPTTNNIVVAKDGTGHFTTIGEAVAYASLVSNGLSRIVIYIKGGEYVENVEITRDAMNIMFVGDGIGNTIITGSRSVGGTPGMTTFQSATVAVDGPGFIAKGITFRNTAGPINQQAVALRSGSDHSVFYQCSFEGYQDTLYVQTYRQFYKECDIYGTVDFIFGNAAVVFQDCNIYARAPVNWLNAVTAQGRTDQSMNTGISIQNCRVLDAPDVAPNQGAMKTYLGRPWKEYSRTVFMTTFMDGLVNPAGWMQWDGNFGLDTLYYGEYANTGPGSGTAQRVNWTGYHVLTTPAEASPFTVVNLIDRNSWLGASGVPYNAGL